MSHNNSKTKTSASAFPEQGSAAGRYQSLASIREPYLRRGRACAKLTIPSLLPEEGPSASKDFKTPHQGIGARGINNLAAKLLLALLPPNTPYFKMEADELTLQLLLQETGKKAEVDRALNQLVKTVLSTVENRGIRVHIFEALKKLLVTGNVALYLPETGGMRVYDLTRYVVSRDPLGTVTEIITKETRFKESLPEEIIRQLGSDFSDSSHENSDATVDIYTHVYRVGDEFLTYQEINDIRIQGTEGSFPAEKCPWIVLRCVKVDGEDYGRSYVEEYLGDLQSADTLSKSLNDGAAAASRIIYLVRPGAVTRPQRLVETPNGGFVPGNPEDIAALQLNKYPDLQVVNARVRELEQSLSYVFLMNSAIQRPGERVTAEEIRYMAQEIENSLGGLYSLMAQELQLPLTQCLMFQMEKMGALPALPEELKPVIIVGMDAIGRGQDLQKLGAFIQNVAPLPGAIERLNVSNYITRVGNATGIDMDGLIIPEEEFQAMQQQQMQMQMMEKLGPNLVNQAGGLMQKGMENGEGATQDAPTE